MPKKIQQKADYNPKKGYRQINDINLRGTKYLLLSKESPIDSVLTTLSEFTKATTEAIEVNRFILEIEVWET